MKQTRASNIAVASPQHSFTENIAKPRETVRHQSCNTQPGHVPCADLEICKSSGVLDQKNPHTHRCGCAHEKHGVDFLNGPTFVSNGPLWSKLRFRYVHASPVVRRRRNYELAPSFCITPSVGIAWNRSQVVCSMQNMSFH